MWVTLAKVTRLHLYEECLIIWQWYHIVLKCLPLCCTFHETDYNLSKYNSSQRFSFTLISKISFSTVTHRKPYVDVRVMVN